MKKIQHPPVIEDTQESQQTGPQNLESYIRDNIFGADFRKYNDQLEKLTKGLENVRQNVAEVEARLLKEISDVEARYRNIPDNIVLRVDKRIDELISRSENDLEKLSRFINELATDFQAQIDGLQTETQKLQNSGQPDKQTLADALIAIGDQLKRDQLKRDQRKA